MADVFELPKSKMAVITTKSRDNDKAKNKAVTALRPKYVTTSTAAQRRFLWHNNNSLQVEEQLTESFHLKHLKGATDVTDARHPAAGK